MFIESSLTDLYRNTIVGFPETQARQFATNTIKIIEIKWTPFLGVKTLYVSGLAKNEGKEYRPVIVFKGINYHINNTKGLVSLATEGREYLLEPISIENSVLVRCSCLDFGFRMKHYLAVDKSLQGPDGKKYEAMFRPGSANPQEVPALCKHLLKLIKVLKESHIFAK